MDRAHPHGSLRNKKDLKKFPAIYIDKDADFASIKLAHGIESRSYLKKGIVVCEDQKGRIPPMRRASIVSNIGTR